MIRTVLRWCFVICAATHLATPVIAADFRSDLAPLTQFLELDRSYSADERAQATLALGVLAARAADMSLAEFQLAVAEITALSRNGHTMLLPGPWAHQFKRTALRYHWFADGLYVVHAPADQRQLLGAKVLAVADHSPEILSMTFSRYFGAREGKRNEWLGFFIESPELLHAAGLVDSTEMLRVSLVLETGEELPISLAARHDPPTGGPYEFLDQSRLAEYAIENLRGSKTQTLYLTEPTKWFRMAAIPELKAVYVQLRANISRPEKQLLDFLDATAKRIRHDRPTNVIIDLRFDGGGDLNLTREFMQSLPRMLPTDGRLFAIVSGRTFSAGIASLGYLKQAAGAKLTIVGEPVGDDLEFWAEGSLQLLPVSKATLLPATERHNYNIGCREDDCHPSIKRFPIRVASLEPDYYVALTYDDYRSGVDPALQLVARIVSRPKNGSDLR